MQNNPRNSKILARKPRFQALGSKISQIAFFTVFQNNLPCVLDWKQFCCLKSNLTFLVSTSGFFSFIGNLTTIAKGPIFLILIEFYKFHNLWCHRFFLFILLGSYRLTPLPHPPVVTKILPPSSTPPKQKRALLWLWLAKIYSLVVELLRCLIISHIHYGVCVWRGGVELTDKIHDPFAARSSRKNR